MAEKLKNWFESWKLAIAVAGLMLTSLTLAYKSLASDAVDSATIAAHSKEIDSLKAANVATTAAISSLAVETAKVSVLLAELKQDLREMRKERQP